MSLERFQITSVLTHYFLVIAAATYGEESFHPCMPWNVGTCTEGVGVSHLDPCFFSVDAHHRLDLWLLDIPRED